VNNGRDFFQLFEPCQADVALRSYIIVPDNDWDFRSADLATVARRFSCFTPVLLPPDELAFCMKSDRVELNLLGVAD
jgi:hypothetical protein